MAKLKYEKAHADIVKYDNSDLLQTRSGEVKCSTAWLQSFDGYCVRDGAGYGCFGIGLFSPDGDQGGGLS